jgi:plasmid stabilization system protein ParE
MKDLRFTPGAVQDLSRLRAFLSRKNRAAAARAASRILQAAAVLRDQPELGRPLEEFPDLREIGAAFGGGAYVLRYRVDADAVVIVRVWHSREERE